MGNAVQNPAPPHHRSRTSPRDTENNHSQNNPHGRTTKLPPHHTVSLARLPRRREAVPFVVRCDPQQEVDDYWSKLSAGGQEIECGWLKDKFGLCWQIVPARLPELIKNPKAMQAMLQMKKFDIAKLERAAQS